MTGSDITTAAADNALDAHQRGRPSAQTIVLLCAGAMIIASVDRINISVAALAMQRVFGWSDAIKGAVLAAFFVGYIATQVVGGWLAHRYGGERVLLGSLVAWSVCAMLTPVAAQLSLPLLLCTRAALGMCEGPCNPAAYNLLGRWVPDGVRTTAVAVYGSAGFLGCFIALLITGPLVVTLGWASPFYLCGGAGLVLAAACHPVLRRLGAAHGPHDASAPPQRVEVRIPWRRLLGLPAFWALVFSFFCTAWVYYVMMLWMPSFFERAFRLDISQSGFLSLTPWVIMFVVMNAAGHGSTLLMRRGMAATRARKLLATGGLFGAGVFLFGVHTAATAPGAMLILCAALGCLAGTYASLAPNVFDLAPRYGEVLFSVLNTFGALPGIVGVSVTGLLVELTHSFDAALLTAAALAMAGALIFLAFGSAQRQLD